MLYNGGWLGITVDVLLFVHLFAIVYWVYKVFQEIRLNTAPESTAPKVPMFGTISEESLKKKQS